MIIELKQDLTLKQAIQILWEIREMGYEAHFKGKAIIDADDNTYSSMVIEVMNK